MFELNSYKKKIMLIMLIALLVLSATYYFFERNNVLRGSKSEVNLSSNIVLNILLGSSSDFDNVFLNKKYGMSDSREVHAVLRNKMATLLKNTNVIQVDIYDKNGKTLFSTIEKEVGNYIKNKDTIVSAIDKKEPLSSIVSVSRSLTISNTLINKKLKKVYFPFKISGTGYVLGVYTDIDAELSSFNNHFAIFFIIRFLVLLILYLSMVFLLNKLIFDKNDFDTVTDLPLVNKSEKMMKDLLTSIDSGRVFGVVMLGINNFSELVGIYGTEASNNVLKIISYRLKELSLEYHFKGIWYAGGSTFALCFVKNDSTYIVDKLQKVFKNLLVISSHEVVVNEREINFSISAGVVMVHGNSRDRSTVSDLFKNARVALQEAKELGDKQVVFFTNEKATRLGERVKLESDLRKSLQNNQFEVFYQPFYSPNTKKIVGAEALLRWRRDDGKYVSPVIFIPLLENLNMIGDVGLFVFNDAIKHCHYINDRFDKNFQISINISGKQLQINSFCEQIRNSIESVGVNPKNIILELTESVMSDDSGETLAKFKTLRDFGCLIAIDDFGTGYSSLSYLKKFEIDIIKIDKSFIGDFNKSKASHAIIKSIFALSKDLDYMVVCEGVETNEQLDFCIGLDADKIQGYLISKPLNIEDFLKFIIYFKGLD